MGKQLNPEMNLTDLLNTGCERKSEVLLNPVSSMLVAGCAPISSAIASCYWMNDLYLYWMNDVYKMKDLSIKTITYIKR